MPQSRTPAGVLAFSVVALTTLACAALIPSPSSPPKSGGAIELQRAPENLECDAITQSYRSATIRIDPAPPLPVWAETETGRRLSVYWSSGFRGGSGGDPVVHGPDGAEVARDDEVIAIPTDRSPDLRGCYVCASENAIYVLEQGPG
jgi:hypothetical protein